LPNLEARSLLLGQIRAFFAAREFIEIEAPIVVPSPGLEVHLDAFAVGDRYLITSPEYQMKRLIAGGLRRIFSLGKVFRRGEIGRITIPNSRCLNGIAPTRTGAKSRATWKRWWLRLRPRERSWRHLGSA